MIHPRVLFRGDPAAATSWVGIAKKLARECYALRIASKVYQLESGVKIRVENIFPGIEKLAGVSKVWIEAEERGLHGFQFIYSGNIADYRDTDTFAMQMAGSAVWVPLSRIKYRNEAWTLPDWSVAIPEATGSTIELCPGKTEIDTEIQRIQKVENLVQANLIPEPLFLTYFGVSKPSVRQVATAWSATEGEIYNFGRLSGYFVGSLADIGYDMHPTSIVCQQPKTRAPESDWPDNSGAQIVESETYGRRRFLILVDASGTFHCWPDLYDGYEDLTPPDSSYANQAYRVTVPAAQVKTAQPPYPAWVHQFPSGFARRDADFPHPDMWSLEPRYVWRYSPDGKKVVGHLLNRSADTYVVQAMDYGTIISEPYSFMDLQTNTTAFDGGYHDWTNVTLEAPGWAEFSIDIVVTGEGSNDFSFSLSLLREEVAGFKYPIAVGYVGPCYLGWASRGMAVSTGDLVILDLRVYTGPVTTQQIADLAQVYSGVATDTTTKAVVGVYNVETAQDLLVFNVHEVPDGHYLNRFNFESMDDYEYTAKFLHIDISTLSFVLRAEYDKFTIGSEYYSFTTGDGTLGSGVQRWQEMEVGLRVIGYGQTLYEERNGGEFGALDKLTSTNVSGYTRMGMAATGYRRFTNSRVPLWSTASLLSSFCYLMAKYLPSNSQPDPLYDANDPCSSWTDYWGTTRTTTLSFVDEVAPAVRGELPSSLTDINIYYTIGYWNTFIIPTAWQVYTTTQAMRTAGDILPDRNQSSTYRHAASPYNFPVFASSDSALRSYPDTTTIMHHVKNYAIGKETYGYIWSVIACNDARFALQVSWDGYYSLWLYDRYVSGTIPQITFHVATTSQKSLVRTEIGLTQISVYDSQYSKTNKPLSSQFKFTNTSFISHILSDTKLQHATLYGTAFATSAATLHDPGVTVEDNGYSYYYTTQQDVKINGVVYESEGAFFSYAHDATNPALVGSAYFIDF